MNEELAQKLLLNANEARRRGISMQAIDAWLKENGYPPYRALVELVRSQRFAPSPPMRSRDVLREMGQGATFDFLDEISGVLHGAIPGGKGYTEARDEMRGASQEFREGEFGGWAPWLQVAGGLLAPGLGAGAGAARVLPRGAGLLARGARIAVPAAAGAAAGALSAAGRAEDIDQAIADIPEGATIGAVAGAIPASGRELFRYGFRLLGRAGRFARNMATLVNQLTKISEQHGEEGVTWVKRGLTWHVLQKAGRGEKLNEAQQKLIRSLFSTPEEFTEYVQGAWARAGRTPPATPDMIGALLPPQSPAAQAFNALDRVRRGAPSAIGVTAAPPLSELLMRRPQ